MSNSEKNTRINNSVRNMFYGTINYIIAFVFPFVIRTVIIFRFGVQYAGINSLFSSILQVLNLSELGFSTAVVYALYEPIVKNDTDKICCLLSFFRTVYRYIGFFIFGAGLIICPFIKNFINGDYPSNINIYLVFILLLINTSFSYLFFGYKSIVFVAYQRSDMTSKTQVISNILMYFLQIISLIIIRNYYAYIVCMIVGTVANNLLLEYNSRKMYPTITSSGILPRDEKNQLLKKIGTLFGHQLDMVIITSADNIVISTFLGLNILTIYGNYSIISNALISVLIMIAHSFAASIGNSIVTETKQKNYINFLDFAYMFINLSGICAILMFSLYQDFMRLWMGETMLLDSKLVLLLCLSFFVRMAKRPGNTYKVEQGLWDADMLKPYIAGIVNLILNIIFVQFIGLYGVVISTIISLGLIEKPWETYVLFKHYFNSGLKKYIFMQLYSVVKLFIIGGIAYFISTILPATSILLFFIKALLIVSVVMIMFIVSSFKDSEFQYIKKKICGVLNLKQKDSL